ncbi:hypothetical protein L2755_02950 [Shewanella abyssi]|uniref:hypothetical protein n=1 Tax=Shewanella abyssi TaxID=311789 RepID=UPI00200EE248|nr:hypothetical protein [Shewanella abyssi]MCL1048594.1 hypothetical protein [Shewanella abyssi]
MDRDNSKATTKLSIFSASILTCCLLYCLTINLFSFTSVSSQSLQHNTYSLISDSEESALNASPLSQPTSSASQFQNSSQFARWGEIEQHFARFLNADDYLITVPINIDWFLKVACDKLRLSGWKESSLLYKFINALI